MEILVPSDTEMRLLAILEIKPLVGKGISTEYERRSGSPISNGTLYTTLRRLVEHGMVRQQSDASDGRFRWYGITARGSEALKRAQTRYSTLANFGTNP